MGSARIRWTAVALFAAVMTVAEVVALQAAARDARRWLASDSARELHRAGLVVAAVVAGSRRASFGEYPVVRVNGNNPLELREALAEAKTCLRKARRVQEVKRGSVRGEI